MKSRKIISIISAAAAMLAAFTPMSGVLSEPLSITANAASVSTYNTGDIFYAALDTDGNVSSVADSLTQGDGFECTVKDDGTISIAYTMQDFNYFRHCGDTVTIPSNIGGYNVSEIVKKNTPFEWAGCKKVVIPDTVKIIGHSAFAYCEFLEEVEFAGEPQLELIDQWAFQDCRSLKSITIPASVETIAYGAFLNGTKDNKIDTSQFTALAEKYGNKIIDFSKIYSLTTVNFAEGSKLKTIGAYAFQRQQALESVTLPEGVEKLECGIFYLCTALKSFTIPASIETIETQVAPDADTYSPLFGGCTSLENITFAENSKLKTLDDFLFASIPALKSITIPAGIETINSCVFALSINEGNELFRQIPALTEIKVSHDNKNFKSVDGVLYTMDGKTLIACPAGKTDVKIEEGVTEIQEGAFEGCSRITSVVIPDGVTKLPNRAFLFCINLKEITLPNSLTELGRHSLAYTEAMTDITIPQSVTTILEEAFLNSALKSINGVDGSYAETFANENSYTFNGETTGTPGTTSPGSSALPQYPSSVGTSTSNNTSTSDDNIFKDDSGDNAADIEVIAKPNVIPKEARFSVRIDEANSTAERVAYNCSFTYNGAEYEPTGTVTVRIPVPIAMRNNAENLKVYHLQDGKYVNMNAKFENGYLVFQTDHFSIYIVTAENLADEIADESESSDSVAADSTSTPTDNDNANPSTGIAVAAVPVLLAASAAVIIVSRKKK